MDNSSSDAYVLLDPEFNIVMANELFVKTFPVVTGKRFQTGAKLVDLIASPDREKMEANLTAALQGQEVKIEHIALLPEGEKRIVISHYPIIKENKVTAIFITVQDITDSKQAEQKLKSLLQRYNLATNSIKLGIWEFNLISGEIQWDENLYYIFDVPAGTPVTYDYWKSFIHPDDQENVLNAFSSGIQNKESEVELSFRIITLTGQEKFIVSKILFLADKKGNINRAIGANWDRTEEHLSKEKQQQSESKMRALLRSSRDGFFLLDKEGHAVLLNEEGQKVLKEIHKIEVELGEYFPDKVLPESKERVLKALQKSLDGKVQEYEAGFEIAGLQRWFTIMYTPAFDENGKIDGVIIISREVTERKQAELKQQALLQRYNLVTSAVKMGTFELDLVTNQLTGDENLYKVYEIDPSTPLTLDLFQALLHPIHRDRVMQKIQNAVANKTPVINQEFRIITPKGHEKYILNKILLQQGKNEEVVRAIGCSLDITAQQRAKEALQESERKMRTLLKTTEEGFYMYDNNLNLILINDRGSKFAQMRSGKKPFLGQHVSEFTREDEIESVLKILNEVLKGNSLEVERNVPTTEGHIWLHLTYTPVKEGDEVMGICIVARDVTELVHSRENLVAARQKAEQSEQLQEQFLANMSHEIRTPLNGIVGMSQLLLNTPLNDDQGKFLQTVLHSSDTLLFLINDILDLSKIKAGKFKIENIEMNIHQVVEEVTEPFRIKARQKGIRFSVMIDPYIPKNVIGDPHRLMQILNNLLSNAFKFTEKGFVKLEVEIADKQDSAVILDFVVSDSGIGIEEDQLKFIFESFAQEGNDTARKFGGTGLGLAITKRLAELQSGTVNVTSQKGQGSRFVVTIPYEEATTQNIQLQNEIKKEAAKEVTNFNGKRVLVAEDNEINQQVITHLLKGFGIDVTVVNTGKKAVNLLENHEIFNLILLDLRMPEMDGFQTLAYLRQKLKSETPVVVLTASVLRDERQRCLDLGANDYLPKPIPKPVLQQCLNKYLLPEENAMENEEKEPTDLAKEIDLKILLALSDKTIIQDVYSKYLQTVPELLEQLKTSAQQENWKEVGDISHKLKSSFNIINIKPVTNLISDIEDEAINQENIQKILPSIEKGIQIYQEALPFVEQEINGALERGN